MFHTKFISLIMVVVSLLSLPGNTQATSPVITQNVLVVGCLGSIALDATNLAYQGAQSRSLNLITDEAELEMSGEHCRYHNQTCIDNAVAIYENPWPQGFNMISLVVSTVHLLGGIIGAVSFICKHRGKCVEGLSQFLFVPNVVVSGIGLIMVSAAKFTINRINVDNAPYVSKLLADDIENADKQQSVVIGLTIGVLSIGLAQIAFFKLHKRCIDPSTQPLLQ